MKLRNNYYFLELDILIGGPAMAVIALICPSIEVAVVDISKSRIAVWHNNQLPIYESGLDDVVKQCRGKSFFFSIQVEKHVYEVEIVSVSVNTSTVLVFGA
ncbi:putative UDP-glucose 6-dehydrogenase [Medicago truncatula]|uniref:Putative UDP-glucose 6-dehydrogenase n=1 Tax=Medicago truncatula TaxID=3880 RepID=A0A396HA52_MEDTR|nr:putative UDP-glucose 6-dehydrogenase [Medicago truncatula]